MKRVLVVEDNRSLLHGLLRLLEGAGFQAAGVSDFEGAEKLVRQERFDFLVTDVDLPGGTGLELVSLARLLRPEMEAIVVTGYGCSAVRQRAEELNVRGYLEKPFDPGVLLRLICAPGTVPQSV